MAPARFASPGHTLPRRSEFHHISVNWSFSARRPGDNRVYKACRSTHNPVPNWSSSYREGSHANTTGQFRVSSGCVGRCSPASFYSSHSTSNLSNAAARSRAAAFCIARKVPSRLLNATWPRSPEHRPCRFRSSRSPPSRRSSRAVAAQSSRRESETLRRRWPSSRNRSVRARKSLKVGKHGVDAEKGAIPPMAVADVPHFTPGWLVTWRKLSSLRSGRRSTLASRMLTPRLSVNSATALPHAPPTKTDADHDRPPGGGRALCGDVF